MKIRVMVTVFLLVSGVIKAQDNLRDYDEICYCAGNTPHSILSYDNNWELLCRLKHGLSRKGLDSLRITYTKSQLKLLSVYKLIRLENGKYFTNFPILDSSQTSFLRTKTSEIAKLIFPLIENDIKSLADELCKDNHTENHFSILFSYVLDGLTWQMFEEKGLIDQRILTTENYPQVGEFWLLTPPRNSIFGTNGESDSSFTISITSSRNEIVSKIYNEEDELLRILLKNYIDSGKITDEKVLATFGKYNIFDKKGNLTVPIIVENMNNKVYYYSNQIALKICSKLTSNDVFYEVLRDLKLKNNKQAIIILYHELMWDLLSIIEEQKLIERPNILNNPNNTKLTDVSKLIYITRK